MTTDWRNHPCSEEKKLQISEALSEPLLGQRFGLLTVLTRDTTVGRGHAYWMCRCDCGGEKIVRASHLKSGDVTSCGCRQGNYTHGLTCGGVRPPGYSSWASMLRRCRNKNNRWYKDRTVCERWLSFEAFLDDMGPPPGPRYSIERIDNEKGYTPGNCRWATMLEQARNRRGNLRILFRGETLCLSEWAERTGISYNRLYARLNLLDWSVEQTLTTAVDARR